MAEQSMILDFACDGNATFFEFASAALKKVAKDGKVAESLSMSRGRFC